MHRHPYKMNQIYMENGISRQAHNQMVKRLQYQQTLVPFLIGLIFEVREIHPGMGLRTIYEKIQPQGIGRDAFVALGVRHSLAGSYITPKTTNSDTHASSKYTNLLRDREFTDVNQVWSSDITYYKLKGHFYYITFIMDVYSRRILGYELSDNLRAENNIRALQMAIQTRGIENYNYGLIHHSDRGSQYVSNDYVNVLEDHGIQVSMCRNVYENTHLERVNRTIKNQYLKHWKIENKYDLKRRLDDAITAYNYDKPHESLGKSSPIDYEINLSTVGKQQRTKLQIFTLENTNQFIDPAQMNLFTIN